MVLVYCEAYDDKKQAQARERWSKTLEGGAQLRADLAARGILGADGLLRQRGSSAG